MKTRTLRLALLGLLLSACGDAPESVQGAEAGSGPGFGRAVALHGDRALIGADRAKHEGLATGKAYVFERTPSGWLPRVELVSSNAHTVESFGCSVALRGRTALVGAALADGAAGSSGAVYVFERRDGAWVETAKLAAADGREGAAFGCSVSLSGDRALVGAHKDRSVGYSAGCAYVFERTPSGWEQTAKLMAGDARQLGLFGDSVSLDGDTALVGAARGEAYVFELADDRWEERTKLAHAYDPDKGIHGSQVAHAENTAIVGSRDDVWVFQRTDEGWEKRFEVQGCGAYPALAGRWFLIGDPLAGSFAENGTGAAQVFRHDGEEWRPEDRLVARNGSGGDWFGRSVALYDDTALIGADGTDGEVLNAGAVHVFERREERWIQTATLTAEKPSR